MTNGTLKKLNETKKINFFIIPEKTEVILHGEWNRQRIAEKKKKSYTGGKSLRSSVFNKIFKYLKIGQ